MAHGPWNWLHGQFKRGNERGNNLEHKKYEVGETTFKILQKQILLQVVDHCWSRHLSTLDHLRSVIGFRGYAQRAPLNAVSYTHLTLPTKRIV